MDFSETEKVASRINWILGNHEKAKKIGENASQFVIENINLEKSAQGFLEAIQCF